MQGESSAQGSFQRLSRAPQALHGFCRRGHRGPRGLSRLDVKWTPMVQWMGTMEPETRRGDAIHRCRTVNGWSMDRLSIWSLKFAARIHWDPRSLHLVCSYSRGCLFQAFLKHFLPPWPGGFARAERGYTGLYGACNSYRVLRLLRRLNCYVSRGDLG